MRIQILVVAMNQKDHNLLKKLNIRSDVIVGINVGMIQWNILNITERQLHILILMRKVLG